MILNLVRRQCWLAYGFAKWSKPKPIPGRQKEQRMAKAISDEKTAKLSKTNTEVEQSQVELDKAHDKAVIKVEQIRKHDRVLDLHIEKSRLRHLKANLLLKAKGLPPRQYREPKRGKKLKPEECFLLPSEQYVQDPTTKKYLRKRIPFGNYAKDVNQPIAAGIKEIPPTPQSRRLGLIGVKLGMTTLWNDWGKMMPITVIELDRVQVVSVREPQNDDGLYHVQVGSGQKNLKRINKPMLGHFMKAGVPPKKNVAEFKVTKDCLLPPGYMLTARHYTPGMYVDVMGKTVGHGFSGTIKKYRFRRQPASHGNSTTTRVLGSTGCRQDPGRVFKMKKMYGRMGGNLTIQSSLRVFKIDVDRNLVYLHGSVPGKAGTLIRLRDSLWYKQVNENMKLARYPTFVEQPGQQYARQFTMFAGERDPSQIDYNDNAYIIDDDEDDPTLSAPTAPGAAVNTNIGLPEN